MSGKLDQSLDQIMVDSKPAGGRARGRANKPRRAAATKAKAAIAAPTGGVQKNTRTNNKTTKAVPTAPAQTPMTGDSKIIVSNLPEDVNETQIKDYFSKTVGSVKKVMLTYGPTGRSRGVATIIFPNASAGAQAAKQLDGVKVDNKAMKIEVVLGARQAPAPAQPKSLSERVAKPKNAAVTKQPGGAKKANGTANTTDAAAKGKGAAREKKSGRAGRPKKKTSDELDAEMMDYFGNENAAPATNNAAPQAAPAPAAGGDDTGMVDEVM